MRRTTIFKLYLLHMEHHIATINELYDKYYSTGGLETGMKPDLEYTKCYSRQFFLHLNSCLSSTTK